MTYIEKLPCSIGYHKIKEGTGYNPSKFFLLSKAELDDVHRQGLIFNFDYHYELMIRGVQK